MSNKIASYNGSHEWSALYLNGKLHTIGDDYKDVAPTLEKLQEWKNEQAVKAVRPKQEEFLAQRREFERKLEETDRLIADLSSPAKE